MKEFGTLFIILLVGAATWILLPLLTGEATGQRTPTIVSPHTKVDYRVLAQTDASQVGIDPALYERQIEAESGFNPNAVSQAGAIGIAQIMPSTASAWGIDPHDPVASLQAAARAMSYSRQKYGGYAEALACYNAGCSTLLVAKSRCGSYWRACLPSETQAYIAKILGGSS